MTPKHKASDLDAAERKTPEHETPEHGTPDHETVSSIASPSAKSRLFRLPPELRNEIYKLVLSMQETIIISSTDRPPKPPLLKACQQIQNEAERMYYDLNSFHTIVRSDEIEFSAAIKYWLEIVTPNGLGGVQSLTFEFKFHGGDVWYGLNIRFQGKIAGFFFKELWWLMDNGLAQSALRVFYSTNSTELQRGRDPKGIKTARFLESVRHFHRMVNQTGLEFAKEITLVEPSMASVS